MNNIEYPGVQLSWNRILAIAQDLPDPIVAKDSLRGDRDDVSCEPEQAAFNRMQCMNTALQNIYTITSLDHGYIAFMATMTTELKHDCPISIAFLKHVIDFSEIPAKQTLQRVTEALLSKAKTKQTKIKAAIMWSMLARKFAGSLAEALWTNELGNTLIQCLIHDNSHGIYALLAIESFALTASLKSYLMDQFDIARVLQQQLDRVVDNNMCLVQQSPLLSLESVPTNSPNLTLVSIKQHMRIYRELKSAFKSCKSKLAKKRKSFRKSQNWKYKSLCKEIDQLCTLKPSQEAQEESAMMFLDLRQLHFCLTWSLSNVFSLKVQKPTAHAAAPFMPYQQTYLQPIDGNSHCKFSVDCLEVRNDTFFFESVRASTGITLGSDKWYYEVVLFTEGIMQIGWGNKRCLLSSQDGSGIGDDAHGFAFDTYRCAVWAAGDLHSSCTDALMKCKAGDVLGCLLDLDENYCTFFINGQDYGFGININKSTASMPLYPTVSLSGHQHILVNFGNQPWYYGVEGAKSVSDAAIVKQDIAAQQMIESEADESPVPLCSICYAEPINTKLFPCEHDEFGEKCAQTFESCPFCRSIIEKILVKESS